MKSALTAISAELEAIRQAGTWREERIITTPQRSCIDTTAADGVVNMCANNYLGLSDNKALIEAAKKAMRMGEAAGDWKPLLKGAEMLTKIEGLDEPETSMDLEAQTYTLHPVLVSAPKNGSEVSDAELDRIRRKYHAEKDKTQEMVEAKLGMFVEAGSHLSDEDFPLPETEPIIIHSPIYSPADEPTMFDADETEDDDRGV